ncbi:hypothetical protein TNCV_2086281 [Trichonephila clavipes]|nr:hypothetical protein TNCV_2086281 [Trichonephila clavipes]
MAISTNNGSMMMQVEAFNEFDKRGGDRFQILSVSGKRRFRTGGPPRYRDCAHRSPTEHDFRQDQICHCFRAIGGSYRLSSTPRISFSIEDSVTWGPHYFDAAIDPLCLASTTLASYCRSIMLEV